MSKMNLKLLGIGSALALSAQSAFAAVDTSAVTTDIAAAATAVAAIGAAVVLVVLGIKTFKWVQRSL